MQPSRIRSLLETFKRAKQNRAIPLIKDHYQLQPENTWSWRILNQHIGPFHSVWTGYKAKVFTCPDSRDSFKLGSLRHCRSSTCSTHPLLLTYGPHRIKGKCCLVEVTSMFPYRSSTPNPHFWFPIAVLIKALMYKINLSLKAILHYQTICSWGIKARLQTQVLWGARKHGMSGVGGTGPPMTAVQHSHHRSI